MKTRDLVIRLVVFLFFLMPQEAFTSDKGLSSEIQTAIVSVLCDTEILAAMEPLMTQKLNLMRKKISAESLKAERSQMNDKWNKIRVRFKDQLNQFAFSARCSHLDPNYFQEQASIAWSTALEKCPERLKEKSELYASELTSRWLKDLKSGKLSYGKH